MRIEELFAKVSPKIVLDHFWNVLTSIEWKSLLDDTSLQEGERSRAKEGFTVLEIKNNLLNESRGTHASPLHQRLCSRSVEIVESLVNELVNSKLLIKGNGILHKSDEYSEFFYLVEKKIKGSAKRIVAWAAWHLYNKGRSSFSMSDILSLLSYTEEDFASEIPYLLIYKENDWVGLLEKNGEMWRLLEEPRHPTRSLLLLDIQERLSVAILELSKSGREFRAEEIVAQVRRLEISSIETFLKRIGLEHKDEKWEINKTALEKIRNIIRETVAKEWPYFGNIAIRNPYFKLLGKQSRHLYVDIPNLLVFEFLYRLSEICNQYSDLAKIYEETEDLVDAFNEYFWENYGDWFSIILREGPFDSKPFGLQLRKRWKKFGNFLETFSQEDIPLEDKYEYLLKCRASSLDLIVRDTLDMSSNMERVQKSVKELCEGEVEQIKNDAGDLVGILESTKDQLYRISKRKTVLKEPSTLLYIPEMISTLQALIYLVENGAIPACYREMRKILENLSWVMFDDFLFFRHAALKRAGRREVEIPNPYSLVTRDWYNWSIQHGCIVRNLGEMKKGMKNIVEKTLSYGGKKGYDWSEKQIEKVLFQGLSTSLVLLCLGKERDVTGKSREFVPKYEVKKLLTLASRDLEGVIKGLGRPRLNRSDKQFIEALVQSLGSKFSSGEVVPPFPSNEFVLGFVVKMLSNRSLKKKYDEYSHFIHSYYTSWHIFPFSSILEFKIFKCEFKEFARNIQQLMTDYLHELYT